MKSQHIFYQPIHNQVVNTGVILKVIYSQEEASAGELKRILGYEEKPLNSIVYINDSNGLSPSFS